ncbi:transmembrane protein 272-like [Anabas testudineus]|uniref:Uncharacterized protein n=1 Tax=Anabas testudineus TaxID=64144 RepID=A0AAQ6IFP7_ANATE|nr:transmembrane protein 272-like [Anabas testudineus]
MPEIQRPRLTNVLPTLIIAFTVVIFFFIIAAQVIVGITFENDCPRQPFIPTYLIGFICFPMLPFFWNKCSEAGQILSISFYFIWFLVGNVAIYSIYEPNYDEKITSRVLYCNKTLYLFAFWTTNFTYVLFGVILVSFCCCKKQEPYDEEQTKLQT